MYDNEYITNVNSSVKDAIIETFENMLFMDAVPVEKDRDEKIEDPTKVRILINHPFPGELVLSIPIELMRRMAATLYMYGDDDAEITDKMQMDVVYELTNTIAGRVMALLVPDNSTFKIGFPEMTESIFIENEEEHPVFFFNVDDTYLFKVNFYMSF